MTNKSKIVVLKFGSSVLRSEKDLPSAVHEIYRWWRDGARVIAVVSAFGDTTDQLMSRAETVCEKPDKAALAALLATGEAASSALLSLALNRVGIPARLLDEVQAGLRTVGGGVDAVPIAVDAARIKSESRRAVVVLPGFVGRGEGADKTLLGRGGSDLTALFLAHHLRAHCVLIKDIDGLYTSDPSSSTKLPNRFVQASYETAARLGGAVVQQKAIRFAAANKLRFAITSIGAQSETDVGPFADRLDRSGSSLEPLRVVLLGCGTVGGGVYQRLAALPNLFEVVGVGSRTGTRARASGVPDNLNTHDLDELLERDCDVVVELIGTTKYASALATAALRSGRHFVTANKALIAVEGDLLSSLAAACGGTLRYSATVGGVLPALEAIERVRASGGIKSFSGILNGTTNYVLDRLAEGQDFQCAVEAAQQAGYAEANPRFDLNGTDAAQKLILLARKAFDVSLAFDSIERTGIDQIDSQSLRGSCKRGRIIRLLAECSRNGDGVKASVKPVELPLDHPLAQVSGAENRLIIKPEVGKQLVLSGTGAGRWPTTEAVMADLFDIRRNQSVEELEELEACVA
jgi:homoserine dehydrogenase